MSADTYIIKQLTERGMAALKKQGQNAPTAEEGLQHAYKLLANCNIPNAHIFHRFSEVMQQEMLIEALQTEEDIEQADRAENEIDGALNVLFKKT